MAVIAPFILHVSDRSMYYLPRDFLPVWAETAKPHILRAGITPKTKTPSGLKKVQLAFALMVQPAGKSLVT
jgi:hypothetical protein